MRWIARTSRWIAVLAFGWMVGTIPACGTMGGGGMKYFIDAPTAASDA
ncbi:MAG TPA: hypothetical protein VET86_11790 [Casimicrobiaceae bacterium]|nr:hypothetical protein [Casimicrobiaceae bacterium]